MSRVRLVVALLGVALAVLAIGRDDRRIAWAAIAVLAIAVLLRVAARRRTQQSEDEAER
ncbi:MAG TPA: hypothetical protein VGL65_11745 [Gemmatimonadales bacterium]|jgi:ABC-type Mn2+/Zn2+ transport system permease subunit